MLLNAILMNCQFCLFLYFARYTFILKPINSLLFERNQYWLNILFIHSSLMRYLYSEMRQNEQKKKGLLIIWLCWISEESKHSLISLFMYKWSILILTIQVNVSDGKPFLSPGANLQYLQIDYDSVESHVRQCSPIKENLPNPSIAKLSRHCHKSLANTWTQYTSLHNYYPFFVISKN